MDGGLSPALGGRAARLTILGAVFVKDLAPPLDQVPVMDRGEGPVRELALFPVAKLGRHVLGVGVGPDALAVEHPVAGTGEGGAAGTLQIDRLLAGDLSLHDALPLLGPAQLLERLGLVDAVAPPLPAELVRTADPDSFSHGRPAALPP